jgi:hypothetical protein
VSTSPLPAVPSEGFAAGFTCASPSGAAITVRAPFKTTTALAAAARRRAWPSRSACTSAVVVPARRAISPGCGVNARGAGAWRASAAASVPRRFKPSASTISGTGSSRTSRRTSACMPGPVGMPGPSATAFIRPASAASAS